jgi:general secretion pathway protein K
MGRSGVSLSGTSRRNEEGVVLLLVLWVLVLISVLVMSWAQEWRTEIKLTANYRDAQEARRLAEAGVFYALGKLAEAKVADALRTQESFVKQPPPATGWRSDQTPRIIELPGGQVEIRVGDEGGKINLNQAKELTLTNFFTELRLPPDRVKTMVAGILGWRKEGAEVAPAPSTAMGGRRPRGILAAQSRQIRFDAVEELAWVSGFENSPLIPRLCDWFTVASVSAGVNVNTATSEVLQALGFSPEQARTIIYSRQQAPYRTTAELPPRAVDPRGTQVQQSFTFQNSPFCTLKATGMVNNKKARHTIKVLARLDFTSEIPWGILSWVDDFPG